MSSLHAQFGLNLALIGIHPKLQALLEASRGQPTLSEMSIDEARALVASRTASRLRGPEVDHVQNLLIPGPRGEIPARLYRPQGARGVAIAFHGGGWLMGSINSFDATSRFLASESGVAVVSVGYRLAPEYRFPCPLDDAWAATKWIRDHSELLGVDCHRMVVVGESAGGNLAAVVCLLAREAEFTCIRLQVLVYPAVDARLQADSLHQFSRGFLQTAQDVEYAFKIYGLGSTASSSDWRVSPLLAASHVNLPPALLISAGMDVLRDDSFAYTRCLLSAGVAATHVCYPGMVHTFFGMRGIVPDSEYAQKQVALAVRNAVEQDSPSSSAE